MTLRIISNAQWPQHNSPAQSSVSLWSLAWEVWAHNFSSRDLAGINGSRALSGQIGQTHTLFLSLSQVELLHSVLG